MVEWRGHTALRILHHQCGRDRRYDPRRNGAAHPLCGPITLGITYPRCPCTGSVRLTRCNYYHGLLSHADALSNCQRYLSSPLHLRTHHTFDFCQPTSEPCHDCAGVVSRGLGRGGPRAYRTAALDRPRACLHLLGRSGLFAHTHALVIVPFSVDYTRVR